MDNQDSESYMRNRTIDFLEVSFDEIQFYSDMIGDWDYFINNFNLLKSAGFSFDGWTNIISRGNKTIVGLKNALNDISQKTQTEKSENFVLIFFKRDYVNAEKGIKDEFSLTFSFSSKNGELEPMRLSIGFSTNAVDRDMAVRGSEELIEFSRTIWNSLKIKPVWGESVDADESTVAYPTHDFPKSTANSKMENILPAKRFKWVVFLNEDLAEKIGFDLLKSAPIYSFKELKNGVLLQLSKLPYTVRGYYFAKDDTIFDNEYVNYFSKVVEGLE